MSLLDRLLKRAIKTALRKAQQEAAGKLVHHHWKKVRERVLRKWTAEQVYELMREGGVDALVDAIATEAAEAIIEHIL